MRPSSTENPAPKVILTGIKPTGQPHLGNYIGAVRPFLELAQDQPDHSGFLFIADCHSLTDPGHAAERSNAVRETAAALLALGLDPEKTVFYMQSAVPEVLELAWILASIAPKGLLNRAHSYKAKKAQNAEKGKKDLDDGVLMGLYSYPILMAADILLMGANCVPVGGDQLQHLEITKVLAKKFHHIYKKQVFVLPQPAAMRGGLLPGLDGQKMSKSRGNTIPLFSDPAALKRLIMKIKTDSKPPDSPKDPDSSALFQIYEAFADDRGAASMRDRYKQGISYGDVKEMLFETIEDFLKDKREIYRSFQNRPEELNRILRRGAEKARAGACPLLKEVYDITGIRSVERGAGSRQ